MNASSITSWLAALCLAALAGHAAGPDKSGVSPNSISVPKGPGSIEGLGDAFQPMLNTGTAKHALSLVVPPGTAGHAPKLALSYEGGTGNGVLGFGWALRLPFVQRETEKGVPRYVDAANGIDDDHDGIVDEADELDRFVTETKEELVALANGDFFTETESAFIRYRRQGAGWSATLPDGTVLSFGSTSASQVADGTRVFRWLVESSTDTDGNVIRFIYTSAPGNENLRQMYIQRIEYGAGAPPWSAHHFIALSYESRPDWFEDCRAGFPVRTGLRLRQLEVCSQCPALPGHQSGDHNSDGTADFLNRRYVLGYWAYAGVSSHWSYLESVTIYGADNSTTLPPARFRYSVCHPPLAVSAASKIIGAENPPLVVMDNPLVDLLDLNADGLPDILKTSGSAGAHSVSLNLGQRLVNGAQVIAWSLPQEVASADGQAWNINLQSGAAPGEASALLSDVDGDGLADLVYHSALNDVFYFKNRHLLGWGERLPLVQDGDAPASPFLNANVKTADIDFDKKMDVIQSVATGSGADYRVWFNLGGQRYSEPVTIAQDTGVMLADSSVSLTDWNGDRMADLVRVSAAALEISASCGHGVFANSRSVLIPDGPLDAAQLSKASLHDLTGDGLADLVVERPEPGVMWYWINLGNDTLAPRRTITHLPVMDSNAAVRWADLNGNSTTDYIVASSNNEPSLQSVDLGELLGCVSASSLLTQVDNGIGRITSIEYASSVQFALADAAAGQPWIGPVPFPVSVVSSIMTSDSLNHTTETHFTYHDGYYDGVEQEFRGFGKVEVTELGDTSMPSLVTRSSFDTGRAHKAMKGRLLRLTKEEISGEVFQDEETIWANPPRLLYAGPDGREVRYAVPQQTQKHILEHGQGTARHLLTEQEFDNYGNQTAQRDFGIVEGSNRSAFNDERFTLTQYAINTNAWILRNPSQVQVTDELGVVFSQSRSFYDEESFSGANLGQVSKGHLTLRLEWMDPATSSVVIKAVRTRYDAYGNPILILDPLASTMPQAHARQLTWDAVFHSFPVEELIMLGANKAPLAFHADYDAGFGVMISADEFNNQRTSFGYDALARLITVVKPGDTASLPTTQYDYQLAVPHGTGGLVNLVETRTLDRDASSPGLQRDHYLITRDFISGSGQKLMTKAEAEPASAGGPARVTISNAVRLNARGRPQQTMQTCFSNLSGGLDAQLVFEDIDAASWSGVFSVNGTLTTLGVTDAPKTSVVADALGRERTMTNPDGSASRTDYEPLATRVFDENDNSASSPHYNTPTVRSQDGLGRLVRVEEITRLNDDGTAAGGLRSWITEYGYDLNDQLITITDSQNNVKRQRFDALKRLVWMNDPDRGAMTFQHDDASNVVLSTDAKGQSIAFTYDGANRVLTEDYLDESMAFSSHYVFDPTQALSSSNRPDVAFFYDGAVSALPMGDGSNATARHQLGRLSYVWDLAGEEHWSYDERGRVEWALKRVRDPLHAGLVGFRNGFSYDSADRVRSVQYPDGDHVPYEFNERGLVSRIGEGPSGSILAGVDYLPSGQVASSSYGNGTRTDYRHDSRQRLQSLITTDASNTPLLQFGYEFDGASNLRSITDLRPTSDIPSGDHRRNSQAFTYDDLYRISSVRYSYGGPTSMADDGNITYRYDRIGNMLAQTSGITHVENGLSIAHLGALSYGSASGTTGRDGRPTGAAPGPHALTSITNGDAVRSFSYDANGNMESLDGMLATWDFKDRLVSVESAAMRADYVYDHQDRRITKRVLAKRPDAQPSCVLYPSKYFEVREGELPIKHVWNGDTRIAQATGSLSTTARVQRLRLAAGWNLIALAIDSTDTINQLQASAQGQTLQCHVLTASGTSLPAGTALWIKATSATTVHLAGTLPSTAPSLGKASTQGRYVSTGFAPLALSAQPSSAMLWHFNSGSQQWQTRFTAPLAALSDAPPTVAVGTPIFAKSNAEPDLIVPDQALSLRYYHQDHLGSSSVITDANGQLVEESNYYPFGHPRHEHRPRQTSEPYGFTQKERDTETGLNYFEARFLATSLGRFTRVDPLAAAMPSKWLGDPQRLNLYSYCGAEPMMRTDPTGLWFGWDDAAFALVGAAVGVGSKYVADKLQGVESGYEDYLGAAVGGAASAGVLLYTANPIAAGAVGGAAANAMTQTAKSVSGKQSSFDARSFAVDTLIGGAVGRLTGFPIKGISVGQNSFSAIFKQMVTKADRGLIGQLRATTIGKMVVGGFTKGAMVEGSMIGSLYSNVFSALQQDRGNPSESSLAPSLGDRGPRPAPAPTPSPTPEK